MLVRFDLTKCRHAAQTDSVLDDPKNFAIGIGLNIARGQICGSRIHPPASIRRIVPAQSVACTAFRAEQPLALLEARTVCWRRRNAFAAASMNEEMLRLGRQGRFQSSRLRQ